MIPEINVLSHTPSSLQEWCGHAFLEATFPSPNVGSCQRDFEEGLIALDHLLIIVASISSFAIKELETAGVKEIARSQEKFRNLCAQNAFDRYGEVISIFERFILKQKGHLKVIETFCESFKEVFKIESFPLNHTLHTPYDSYDDVRYYAQLRGARSAKTYRSLFSRAAGTLFRPGFRMPLYPERAYSSPNYMNNHTSSKLGCRWGSKEWSEFLSIGYLLDQWLQTSIDLLKGCEQQANESESLCRIKAKNAQIFVKTILPILINFFLKIETIEKIFKERHSSVCDNIGHQIAIDLLRDFRKRVTHFDQEAEKGLILMDITSGLRDLRDRLYIMKDKTRDLDWSCNALSVS